MNKFEEYMHVTQAIVHLVEAKQALVIAGIPPSLILPVQEQIVQWSEQLKGARINLAKKYDWNQSVDFGIHRSGDVYIILFEDGTRQERKL